MAPRTLLLSLLVFGTCFPAAVIASVFENPKPAFRPRLLDALQCRQGSEPDCKVSPIAAGKFIQVTGGLRVSKSTETNSCPTGWKIWSPAKADWIAVYNYLSQSFDKYPSPLIVDVTRSENGCGGCKAHAMNSDVSQQSSWKTADGSAWWLRDSPFVQQDMKYEANCYMKVTDVNPNHVQFDSSNCNYAASSYLCQPIRTAITTSNATTSTPLLRGAGFWSFAHEMDDAMLYGLITFAFGVVLLILVIIILCVLRERILLKCIECAGAIKTKPQKFNRRSAALAVSSEEADSSV